MSNNAFEIFMAQHPPVGVAVQRASSALWDESAIDPALKEHVRITLAELLGCSYCTRFRTEVDGKPILQGEDELDGRTIKAQEFARAIVNDQVTDEQTVAMQQEFTSEEFADLVFSIGWFIGMQHVGRLMHWDDSCPVASIRALVQAGDAA